MIDAVPVEYFPASASPASPAENYAAQPEWEPLADPGNDVYPVLGLEHIQVWSDGENLASHTVMRNGEWGGVNGRLMLVRLVSAGHVSHRGRPGRGSISARQTSDADWLT
jgi:hypothetical protein